ncbi:hypothetical protein K488DRAFT_55995, partial [Vararia minispora EC-137]
QYPVLVLEIKPPHHLLLISTREVADRLIRRRLVDLSECSLLPVLYGISAMGTKLCFYELEKASRRMSPRRIFSDPRLITDVAPKVRWDCNVLEASGEQRLRILATWLTEACERLQA